MARTAASAPCAVRNGQSRKAASAPAAARRTASGSVRSPGTAVTPAGNRTEDGSRDRAWMVTPAPASCVAMWRPTFPVAPVIRMVGMVMCAASNLNNGLSQARLANMPSPATELTIGDLSERSGVSPAALGFYEREGLIHSRRTAGNQRRYHRTTLRRVAFIRASQTVGIPLSAIGEVLAFLPKDTPPTRAFWVRAS